MSEIKNTSTPINSKFLKASKKFLNGLFMPLSTSNSAKQEADLGLFENDYMDQLEELFENWIFSMQVELTDTGKCITIYLEPGSVRDYGGSLACNDGKPLEVKAMVKLAKMKGWKGIHLTGTEDFKERVFIQAVMSGDFTPDQITGYNPSPIALDMVAMAEKLPGSEQEAVEKKSKALNAKKLGI